MAGERVVLVVGSGGREHAIVWACADYCDRIVVAPGNGGTTGTLGKCVLEQVSASTVAELVVLAQKVRPSIVIVGPEAPLADGLSGE